MSKQKKNQKTQKKSETSNIKNICKNRRAFYDYEVLEKLECGIVLTGTEVKSLRDRGPTLDESYARVLGGELWLLNADIPEYSMGNYQNHPPRRQRKLLVHKKELAKLIGKANQQGFTLIPLGMYFKDGWAKVELGIARGKQMHDKRETQKKADADRQIRQAMGRRR